MNTSPSAFDPDPSRYPELRKWVVGCLSGHKKPNDIIFQLCHRTGWDWNQSKRFVEQVTQLDQKQVYRNRMPLLLGVGLLFMASGAYGTFSGISHLLQDLATLKTPVDPNQVIQFLFMARTEYGYLASLVVGLAAFAGGSWGVWSAVKSAATGEGDDLMQSGPNQPDRR
jgi:hypothetical protein